MFNLDGKYSFNIQGYKKHPRAACSTWVQTHYVSYPLICYYCFLFRNHGFMENEFNVHIKQKCSNVSKNL
jgi:hypothetical protein